MTVTAITHTTAMLTLRSFLDAHRSEKDAKDWNITGMGKEDTGKYTVSDVDYDKFLELVHSHIFGKIPRASSLLERHHQEGGGTGPQLVDLDLRYETGGPLIRRFTSDHIRDFIAEYVAAMIYFSKVESLPRDLVYYHLEKPSPETDKSHHKDGVHIQCPTITTTPKYQYGIRGFLLNRDVIGRVFHSTGISNTPEDCYDVSVIHRNNWFMYGACKPDKAQYKVAKVWKIGIADVRDALDGGDPAEFEDLVEIVKDLMVEVPHPATSNTLDLMKKLSIRVGHTKATPLDIRAIRTAEWEDLMITWGSGKAKQERALPMPTLLGAANTTGADGDIVELTDSALVVTDSGESRRVTSANTPEDIALAYRLCKECINAERRAGEYQEWINLAICLKNIANTDDSYKAWAEITHRVDPSHKKAAYTESQLRTKWNLVRIDSSKKLGMGSLQHWAREDNPERHRSIMSETHTSWIVNFAKDTHVNVASFVCHLYQHEFRCSIGQRKGIYEWYQYPEKAHSWRYMRNNVELRSRLSGLVKNEYVTAAIALGARHNAPENSERKDERDRIDDKRKKLFAIERQLEMAAFKDNVVRECQEKFYDDEFIQKLNSNPYLVGVSNGVLVLRPDIANSGAGKDSDEESPRRPRVSFRDGRPDDNVSFQMGHSDPDMDSIPWIPYDPTTPEQCELRGFFERIYPDKVLREYMLTLLASCLEGTNKEQRFYVMQGVGSNGKSMIEKLMEETFGDYGTSMSTTVFTRKKPDSGSANPDIITVKCRRYIHMGEPDDNEKINTSIMKQYSGGDRIPARGLFSDQEKFSIMGKIFMSCNDLPPVNKMDGGTWRRIRVIPHVSIFKDPGDAAIDPSKNIYEKDLDLEHKIRTWRVAFLSLLVHYYDTYYLAHGLREPDCVTAASNKYKVENDLFMSFFNENFVKDSTAGPVLAKDVRNIFRDWKKTQGKMCDITQHQVLDRMKLECGSGSTDKEFWGIRISDEIEDMSGSLIKHDL